MMTGRTVAQLSELAMFEGRDREREAMMKNGVGLESRRELEAEAERLFKLSEDLAVLAVLRGFVADPFDAF